ncbi:MAG TPA: hypothetical protein VF941_11790 [Clostridia bacterium]
MAALQALSKPNKFLVNWNNPLTQGLVFTAPFFENAGSIHSLVHPLDTMTLTGNAVWDTANGGKGLNGYSLVGSSTGAILTTPSSYIKPANTVTIAWYGLLHDDGTGNIVNNPSIFGMANNNANSNPFVSYDIERRSNFNLDIRFAWNNAGTFHNLDISNGLSGQFKSPIMIVMTIDATNVIGYLNGVQVGANGSGVTSISYGATAALQVNRHITSTTDSASSFALAGHIWNRVLTSTEVKSLYTNPWQIYVRPNYNPFYVPSPAVAGTAVKMQAIRGWSFPV